MIEWRIFETQLGKQLLVMASKQEIAEVEKALSLRGVVVIKGGVMQSMMIEDQPTVAMMMRQLLNPTAA